VQENSVAERGCDKNLLAWGGNKPLWDRIKVQEPVSRNGLIR